MNNENNTNNMNYENNKVETLSNSIVNIFERIDNANTHKIVLQLWKLYIQKKAEHLYNDISKCNLLLNQIEVNPNQLPELNLLQLNLLTNLIEY